MKQTFIKFGTRIAAGKGDDHDTGKLIAHHSDTLCMIAWDSGVRTPLPLDDLAPPWAAEIIPVDGGYHAFESAADAAVWRRNQ